MAVIVRNTFLDIADHKFLHCDEPCLGLRRCQSVPRSFKLATPLSSLDYTPIAMASPDSSSKASLLGDFFSDDLSAKGSCAAEPSFRVPARAHTLPAGAHCRSPSIASTASISDVGINSSDSAYDASSVGSPCDLSASAWSSSQPEQQSIVCTPCMQVETREDSIVNAVHSALEACGRTTNIKIDRGPDGKSATLITAYVGAGVQASSRSYEVLHVAKRALEAITGQMRTVALLSARVQKEDCGYSLRSSVAYVPKEAEDKMCWDLFQKGCCLRRNQCRWYHPQASDIGKIKISIRCAQEQKQASSSSSGGKLKISLGDLL